MTDHLPPLLKARRKELGWTLYAVARRSGYSENTVRRVLQGEAVNLATFAAVARALGYDLHMQRTDDP